MECTDCLCINCVAFLEGLCYPCNDEVYERRVKACTNIVTSCKKFITTLDTEGEVDEI